MRYQTRAPGVETAALATDAKGRHRARGAELAKVWRVGLKLIVARHRPAPEPAAVFRELGRRDPRAASVVTLAQATSAVLTCPRIPVHERHALIAEVLSHVSAWIPTDEASAIDAYRIETVQQGVTDAAQGLALRARDRGDLGAVETAIAETARHIGAQWHLLQQWQRLRTDILADRRRVA